MKISIEVEVSNEEIPMANEFLALLNQLASKFGVESGNNGLLNGNGSSLRVYSQSNGQVLNGNASGGGNLSNSGVNGGFFERLLRSLLLDEDSDSVAFQINRMLMEHPIQFDSFVKQFELVVFDPIYIAKNQSLLPFFSILTKISEPNRSNLRDRLISTVLKVLAIKRPIDANRMDFFLYAEAFAILLKMEMINISGGVSTMNALLQKPETRSAGITMLGKSIELSLSVLNEKSDPSVLGELRNTLDQSVREPAFKYDLDYIRENMNWSASPSTSPSVNYEEQLTRNSQNRSPSQNNTNDIQLYATQSLIGHNSTIFAIGYDDLRESLISTSKDGTVTTWSKEGRIKDKLLIPRHYACALDISSKNKTMFVCGVPKDSSKDSSAIIGLSLNDKGTWVVKGSLERNDVKLVSCVKALNYHNQNLFATGESSKNQNERNKVKVYDANQSFSKMAPVVSYEEHDDIITSMAQHSLSEGLFFTGSRDSMIKLWDYRTPKSAATVGTPNSSGKIVAHEGIVTSLDCFDSILVSVSMDKKVAVWDIRKMSDLTGSQPLCRQTIDDSGILKVSIGPTITCSAVSTLKGLYLIDFASGTVTPAVQNRDKAPAGRYHDLKWSSNRVTLYAAGDDMRVDLFSVQNPART